MKTVVSIYCELCHEEFRIAACHDCGQICEACEVGVMVDHKLEKHKE